MAKVRAYVYQDAALVFKVYPPVVVLQEGDKFELVNTVDKDCTLDVPAGVFGQKVAERVPKKSVSPAKVAVAGRLATEYEVKVNGIKAIAHSDPVIIIDP